MPRSPSRFDPATTALRCTSGSRQLSTACCPTSFGERTSGLSIAQSRALLGDACALAQRELVAEDDGDAWEVFRRHFLDGIEYADIGLQLRITAAAARTRARRASYRFERALRQLLEDEGVARDDLDEEIAWLMEVSGR